MTSKLVLYIGSFMTRDTIMLLDLPKNALSTYNNRLRKNWKERGGYIVHTFNDNCEAPP